MSVEAPQAPPTPSSGELSTARRTSWPVLGAGLLVLLALCAGLLLGRGMGDATGSVGNRVDVGFAQDMKVHHAQAVAMSAAVHDGSQDPEVVALALDILTTQQAQIGMMSAWLEQWGQTQAASGPTMSWMGGGHSGPMPGMASADELASLQTLPAGALEEQFLRLMIRHHAGALPMAAAAIEQGGHQPLVRLAGTMLDGQQAEIDLMQDMLAARGHAPEPVEGAAEGAEHAHDDGAGHSDGEHG
jgi:uncharacterized protein (DUF305 family)